MRGRIVIGFLDSFPKFLIGCFFSTGLEVKLPFLRGWKEAGGKGSLSFSERRRVAACRGEERNHSELLPRLILCPVEGEKTVKGSLIVINFKNLIELTLTASSPSTGQGL